jgi:1-phosphofructokinase family hexose kinase
MIQVLSLSPAVDKIYFIDNFHNGGLFRIDDVLMSAGGKGINVARVLKLLGQTPYISGFIAGSTGNWLFSEMEKMGINKKFIELEGESRTNINVIDKISMIETEILERGPIVTADKLSEYLHNFENTLETTDILVCSGGLPLGIDENFYSELLQIANKKGIKTILDANGNILEYGLKSAPYIVKPNRRELSMLIKKEINTMDDILEACELILEKGVYAVAVSLSSEGAVLVTRKKAFKVGTLDISYKNAIGSGDSMVAGIASGLYNGMDLEDAFIQGVACGISNAEFEQIGIVDINKVKKYMEDLKCRILPLY